MAPLNPLGRRVRARLEEDEYDEGLTSDDQLNQDSEDDSNASDGDSASSAGDENADVSEDEMTGTDGSEEGNEDVQSSLNNISFGALAKAQASLGKRKRTNDDDTPDASNKQKKPTAASALSDLRQRLRENNEKAAGTGDQTLTNKKSSKYERPPSRTSKHAPMAQSTKHAVSRKRTILEPSSAAKFRDPRFDATITASAPNRASAVSAANKNYAFLSDYRDSEIADLKTQIKKTKDERAREALKRQLMSMEAKKRAEETKKAQQEIVQKHRKREKELVKEGKKNPYFLKKSEIRKEVVADRFKNMGAKQRDKALQRKRKKVAGKEKKAMPMARRSAATDGGDV